MQLVMFGGAGRFWIYYLLGSWEAETEENMFHSNTYMKIYQSLLTNFEQGGSAHQHGTSISV